MVQIFSVNGKSIGLKLIGNKSSHYRYETPDGEKHRSVRAATVYLKAKEKANIQSALQELGRRWHARVEVA